VDTLLSLSIAHVKLVVLCGYSVKFVNCSCKLVVLCGYSVKFVNYYCKVGGFMWILC
jgi:hypothetical protein